MARIEAVGDFDWNGSDDLVIRNTSTGDVSIRMQTKLTAGTTVSVAATGGTDWMVGGAGDFNRDDHLDIVLRKTTSPFDVRIWYMQQNGQIGSTATPPFSVEYGLWRVGAVGDFNSDHFNDIVWRKADGGVYLRTAVTRAAAARGA